MFKNLAVPLGSHLGQNDKSNDKDDCPRELHGDRNSIAARVIAIFCGVVDNGSQEEAL